MKICLLGSPRIEIDDTDISLGRRKAVALLARLAVVSQPERRDTLATLLWPQSNRARGLAALRRVLRSLTRALGRDPIRADRKTIGLRQDRIWVDVTEFRALVARAPSGEVKADQWRMLLPDLTRAWELWRGDFLEGFGLKDSPAFDEWQLYTAEELRGDLIRLFQSCVAGFERSGEIEHAIEYAQRWLSLDNLSEEVHRHLMRLFASRGQRSRALKQYEACVALLDEELQVEPESETRAMFEAIRDGAFSPSAAPPESAPIQVIHRLPEPPTPFIGRNAELARIMGRLKESECRLLTVVGPGGIGKTRLSLEAARAQFGEFAHGVCFVGLAASTPALLVGTIAESLGIELDPRGDPETQLLANLREREMMLVLDNFEHLLERADFVSSILSSCLGIKIIVTSRERLNLQGEWLFEIQGLEVPDEDRLEELENYSAVRLFIQAARRVQPEFFLVDEDRPYLARICSMVGGVPLGIELAAGWMRILSCREICEQIETNIDFLTSTVRDLPERHRSLRAVFDSSLKLLSSAEQEVMAKLSVFKGSWTRHAAQQIAASALPTLLSLVDKSLLRQSVRGRFEMHELIRQFAVELLEATPERMAEIRDRHAHYYLEFLSKQEEHLKGDKQTQTVDAIRHEISNIRTAWQWASNHSMADLIAKSVVSLYGFFLFSNWFREGVEMLEHASSSISKQDHPRTWAKVTLRWGRLATRLGRFRQSKGPLEDCLKILRETDETDEIAFSLAALSVIHNNRGEYDAARRLAEESGELYRRAGNTHGTANTMVQLGRIIGQIGDYHKSKEYLQDAYRIFEELGDQNGVARCLLNLGNCALFLGEAEESIRLQERCLEIFTRLGERKGVASALNNLGLIYEDLGDHQKAKELSLRGVTLFRETGYHLGTAGGGVRLAPVFALENLGRATFSLGEFEESRRYFTEALQSALAIDAVPQSLLALLGLARLQLQDRQYVTAFELLTFIVHHPNLNNECRIQAVELIEDTKSKIPEEDWRAAEERGKKLEFEKLVEKALQRFDLRAPVT